jgi:hypothetical protein
MDPFSITDFHDLIDGLAFKEETANVSLDFDVIQRRPSLSMFFGHFVATVRLLSDIIVHHRSFLKNRSTTQSNRVEDAGLCTRKVSHPIAVGSVNAYSDEGLPAVAGYVESLGK